MSFTDEEIKRIFSLLEQGQFSALEEFAKNDADKEACRKIIDIINKGDNITEKDGEQLEEAFVSFFEGVVNEFTDKQLYENWNQLSSNHTSDRLKRVIEFAGEDADALLEIWKSTISEVQEQNDEVVVSLLDKFKTYPDVLNDFWKSVPEEMKIRKPELLAEVIDAIQDNPAQVAEIWCGTNKAVQRENSELFDTVIRGNSDNLVEIWDSTDGEVQKSHSTVLSNIVNDSDIYGLELDRVWDSTAKEVQLAHSELVSVILKKLKDTPLIMEEFWTSLDNEIQLTNYEMFPSVIETLSGQYSNLTNVLERTPKDVQKMQSPEVFIDCITKFSGYDAQGIWQRIDSEVKEKTLPGLVVQYKGKSDDFIRIWENTEEEIQRRTLAEVVKGAKEDRQVLTSIFSSTNNQIQKDNLRGIAESLRDEPGALGIFWTRMDEQTQKDNIESVIEILQFEPDSATRVWNTTSNEIRKEKFSAILEQNKDNFELLGYIWKATDFETQKENAGSFLNIINGLQDNVDLLSEVLDSTNIEFFNGNPEIFSAAINSVLKKPETLEKIWSSTNLDVKKENSTLFPSVIEALSENPSALQRVWGSVDKEMQQENASVLPQIIDKVSSDMFLLERVWNSTDSEVQKENPQLFNTVVNYALETPSTLSRIWRMTDSEIRNQNADMLPSVIDATLKNRYEFLELWGELDRESKRSKLAYVIGKIDASAFIQNGETIKRVLDNVDNEIKKDVLLSEVKNPESNKVFHYIWRSCDEKLKRESLFEVMEAAKLYAPKARIIWRDLDESTQEETISQVKEILKDNTLSLAYIWEHTSPKLQQTMYFDFVKEFDDKKTLETFWKSTNEQVKRDVLIPTIQMLKDEKEMQLAVWKETPTEIKREKFESLLALQDEKIPIAGMWRVMPGELQNEKLPIIVDNVKDTPSEFATVWKYTNKQTQMNEFYSVCEQLKSQVHYKDFVRDFLGEVEFDDNGLPMVPDEIKSIVFNPQNVNRLTEAQQTELVEKLPTIIKSWPAIKENIQLKRANNIKVGSLEVRTNIQEILTAVDLMNRPIPNTPSAEELMEVPGSEKLGVDTLYVASPSTATQRAYDLAQKMDEAPLVKKFPDMSVEDKETGISLSVLNPRDKSAILLGYETHCCFRPNGNADNEAKDPNSLLQYCTTTPYGGVIKVGRKNEVGSFDEVYMGTPILASGNCLMLHSYETDNRENNGIVNKLLVEAAKKAIETSNGGIKVVMMTDLYTGPGRLNAENGITIPSTFRQYAEGEYAEYEKMYTNLEHKNCILAVKVGERILQGEELKIWYENECHNNPEVFNEKVGLKLGEISTDYTYPKLDVAKRERSVVDKEVVNAFEEEYQKLKKERAILARATQRAKLEGIESPSDLQRKELAELTATLSEIDQREGTDYAHMTASAARNKLKENNERSFRVYSGDDIGLLMQAHGISEAQMEAWVTERVETEFASKEASSQGKKAKNGMLQKEKGKLISEIKRSGESELVADILPQVISGTITKEGLAALEAHGIDTSGYEKASASTRDEKSSAEIIEMQKKQRVSKAMKDETLREEVLAEKLFPEIPDEEIEQRVDSKTKLTLKNKLSDVVTRKIIEEASSRDGIQAENRQLTEAEKEKRENEVRKAMRNFEGLMVAIRDNDFSEEQVQEMTEMRDTYGIDLSSLRQEFAEPRKSIRDELRKEGVKKQKASVSIGFEERTRIRRIVDRINPENSVKKYDKIVYGDGWYIGYDESSVDVCQSKEISGEESIKCKKAMEEEIAGLEQTPETRGVCEQIRTRYGELYTPTLSSKTIGRVTAGVPAYQKEAVQQAARADMARENRMQRMENVQRRENPQENGEIN